MHELKANGLLFISLNAPQCVILIVLTNWHAAKCALRDLMHQQVTHFEQSDWLEVTWLILKA